jgi:hypothetical protein
MPYWSSSYAGSAFGLRKVYEMYGNKAYKESWNYQYFAEGAGHYHGYVFNPQNFAMAALNCYMICIISFQAQVFNSYGY